ncbi:MAG: hypothetical protein AB7E47_11540 [Desulfovibrionaceae bacterium]
MIDHAAYHYSITLHSEDLALVHCLRALAQCSQLRGNNRIPWGNTREADWRRADMAVTFRFSNPAYREVFAKHVRRLLPPGLWREVARDDHDPAMPTR